MTLTVVDPPVGHPMGYGQRILAHSSTPPVGAETIEATLIWLDGLGVPRKMAVGSGVISSGSLNASIMFGVTYYGEWNAIGASAPRGAPLGATLECDLVRRDNAGANVETATVAAWFLHDPVSQLATLMNTLPPAHDPMLDLILAAVRKTFTSF